LGVRVSLGYKVVSLKYSFFFGRFCPTHAFIMVSPTPDQLTSFLQLFSLKPITGLLLGKMNNERSHKETPTAWLDGMRGYAALFVSLYHLRIGYSSTVHLGYGARPEDNNLLELPIIRLLTAGQAMVAVFFFVSGFSLAWGPLKDLRAGQAEKSLNRLRSALFRRFFRLYIPVVACTFIIFLCMRLGLYQIGLDADTRTEYKDPVPELKETIILQFGDWLYENWVFVNYFTHMGRHAYYVHAWSIGVEFSSSILLFTAMVTMNRLRLLPRIIGFVICTLFLYFGPSAHLWTFFMGATLCQLTLWWQERRRYPGGFAPKTNSWRGDAPWIGLLCLGLWLLSYPEWKGDITPGYGWFQGVLPTDWSEPHWFAHTWAAVLISLAAIHNRKVQWIFSNKLARYLASISYALYLIHGIVIHVVALWLLPMFWAVTGKDTVATWELGFFLYLCVHVPITFVCAGVFTRMFDDTAVRFAKWLDVKVSIDAEEAGGYQMLPIAEVPLMEEIASQRVA
jgi:peptidoglycan/LPS O-acetylase OafA/YrhL